MTGKIFQVEISIISKSIIIKSMIDDLGIGKDPTVEVDSEIIPLPNLSEPVLQKLIDWCTHHEDDPPPPPVIEGEEDLAMFNDEIIEWDQDFLKMEDSVLFDLILAANYLDVKPLLDLTTTHIAHLIVEARTPEGIRKRFNIKNDLTPEDLKKIEKEAQTWLDSDDEEEGEKKPEETKTEEAPPSAESSEPQPGTSKDSEEAMERSPMEYMRAEESELEELQGAVGGSD